MAQPQTASGTADMGGPNHDTTKRKIIEAAGQVFAERGAAAATGKEIALRARVNTAAINYHFGGVDRLYAEVLIEAHRRLIAYDDLRARVAAPGEPANKIRSIIRQLGQATLAGEASGWPLRVLVREIVTPSPASAILRERELLPKRELLLGLLGELLGQSPDSPDVVRSCFSIMAPLIMLALMDRAAPQDLLPGGSAAIPHTASIIEHLEIFAMGGLAAIAVAARTPPEG